MTDFKLEARVREEKGNLTRLAGALPAIVYGNDFKNIQISLDKAAFSRIYKEAGTSNLIEVAVEGHKPFKTLIHEIQLNPKTSELVHVDFFKVNMKEKIHAEIPLTFIGDSIAIIEKEGSLLTPKDSIEVECLPGDLIPELEVDISVLDDFEKDIRVSDLKVPAGIEILDDPEEVIAHVEEPRSDEELEALNEEVVENVDAIEVENKGEEATEGEAEKTE